MMNTQFSEVMAKLDVMEKRQIRMARQVEALYYEEPVPERRDNVVQIDEPWDADEETIKKLGTKIAYNLIEDPIDVQKFKDWIYRAKRHPRTFTDMELKYIDIADKNFDDIRLSRKHLNILQNAYQKLENEPWPFRAIQGYMYKHHDQIAWEWFRG